MILEQESRKKIVSSAKEQEGRPAESAVKITSLHNQDKENLINPSPKTALEKQLAKEMGNDADDVLSMLNEFEQELKDNGTVLELSELSPLEKKKLSEETRNEDVALLEIYEELLKTPIEPDIEKDNKKKEPLRDSGWTYYIEKSLVSINQDPFDTFPISRDFFDNAKDIAPKPDGYIPSYCDSADKIYNTRKEALMAEAEYSIQQLKEDLRTIFPDIPVRNLLKRQVNARINEEKKEAREAGEPEPDYKDWIDYIASNYGEIAEYRNSKDDRKFCYNTDIDELKESLKQDFMS